MLVGYIFSLRINALETRASAADEHYSLLALATRSSVAGGPAHGVQLRRRGPARAEPGDDAGLRRAGSGAAVRPRRRARLGRPGRVGAGAGALPARGRGRPAVRAAGGGRAG